MSQDALTSELKERLWDLKRWCRHDRYDHDRTDHQMVADFHCATIDMVEMALRSLAPPSAIAPSEPNWRHCPHRECGENMRCNWSMLTCAAPRMEVVPIQEDMARLRKLIPGCDCTNPLQCWEPCGTLGHSEEHARVVKDE